MLGELRVVAAPAFAYDLEACSDLETLPGQSLKPRLGFLPVGRDCLPGRLTLSSPQCPTLGRLASPPCSQSQVPELVFRFWGTGGDTSQSPQVPRV